MLGCPSKNVIHSWALSRRVYKRQLICTVREKCNSREILSFRKDKYVILHAPLVYNSLVPQPCVSINYKDLEREREKKERVCGDCDIVDDDISIIYILTCILTLTSFQIRNNNMRFLFYLTCKVPQETLQNLKNENCFISVNILILDTCKVLRDFACLEYYGKAILRYIISLC